MLSPTSRGDEAALTIGAGNAPSRVAISSILRCGCSREQRSSAAKLGAPAGLAGRGCRQPPDFGGCAPTHTASTGRSGGSRGAAPAGVVLHGPSLAVSVKRLLCY